jgi:hypothetical protein
LGKCDATEAVGTDWGSCQMAGVCITSVEPSESVEMSVISLHTWVFRSLMKNEIRIMQSGLTRPIKQG